MSNTDVRVSIVIPNYNGAGLLRACLLSILKNTNLKGLELIVVDNGSHDESVAVADEFDKVFQYFHLIRNDRNTGVTRALNQGIENAGGHYLVLLNNDTVVQKDWLDELIKVLDSDRSVAGAQCKLLKMSDPGRIDSAGCLVDMHGCPSERGARYGCNEIDEGQYDDVEEVFSAGCPASIFRTNVLRQAGMFDSEYFTGCEDLDLCWRIRLMGYKIVYVPKAVVLHLRSSTILRPDLSRKTWFHFRKNGLATLVKNYGIGHLIYELPLATWVLFMHGLKDLLVKRDPLLLAVSTKALAWNVTRAKYLYQQRMFVQRNLRRVDDNIIQAHMRKKCLLIVKFLKPYLHYWGQTIAPSQ